MSAWKLLAPGYGLLTGINCSHTANIILEQLAERVCTVLSLFMYESAPFDCRVAKFTLHFQSPFSSWLNRYLRRFLTIGTSFILFT